MARHLQVEFPGAIYHITCRMVGDWRTEHSLLFRDEADRQRFMEQLSERGTARKLEMEYMREQLRRAGNPVPQVVGIDEISIRKGHIYRIVVSGLVRRRSIWFGGEDPARKRAWTRSTRGWGPRRASGSGWRSWACGSRSATRRSNRSTHRRPPSCSTSSIFSVTWEKPWTRIFVRFTPISPGFFRRPEPHRFSDYFLPRNNPVARWRFRRSSANRSNRPPDMRCFPCTRT